MEVSRPIFTDKTGVEILNAINRVALRPDIVDNLTTDDANKVLSANQGKVLNDTKYTKPGTGIPKTDLSSDVQSLLTDFGASGSDHSSGLVPDPGSTSGTTKYLREDGTWEVPPGGGEDNVIESISVNGTPQTVTNKNVDITVPVVASSIADGETGYATGDQVYDYVQANKGDTNVIEIVKVNGSALTPDANKAVDITVPAATVTDVQTKTTDSGSYATVLDGTVAKIDLSGYALKSDITSVLYFKGTKATASELPTTGAKVGDVWAVSADNSEYVCTAISPSVTWEKLGPVIDLSGYVQTSRTVNSKALSSDITLDGSDVALTGYTEASSASAVAATDTVNQAIGKVEKKVDDAVGAATTYAFAEGSVNGAFQVTPTVGGTAGSSSSVSIHGLGSAAYADTTDFVSSSLTPAEAGAEANVIETVKVNGTSLTPDADKAVDVIVPSVATAIADGDTGYTTGSQVYNYLSDDKALLASALSELSTLIQYIAFTSGSNNAQDTVEALGEVISSLNGTGIITKRLTGCTLSNTASSVNIGDSYTSSLVPNEDVFTFSLVSIRMGGVDITSTTWNSTTETITISSVTGPISITAVANVVLPTGYTRLSYIAADGNQYTVLNTEEGDATRAVYEVMITGQAYRKGNHILSGYRTYFPFLRTTSGGDGELGAANRGNETAASGDSKLYNWSFNQRYKLEGFVGEDEVLKVDGTTIYSLPRGGSQDLTTPLAIFDYRGPGGGSQDYKFRGRLYSMSIYGSNGTLLKKLVPCKNASNVAGLYDLVEGIFYTSDTATAYIAGEEA